MGACSITLRVFVPFLREKEWKIMEDFLFLTLQAYRLYGKEEGGAVIDVSQEIKGMTWSLFMPGAHRNELLQEVQVCLKYKQTAKQSASSHEASSDSPFRRSTKKGRVVRVTPH